MARSKKTMEQYLKEYVAIIAEIHSGTPYGKIAEEYGVGVSTVQRLHNMHLYPVVPEM